MSNAPFKVGQRVVCVNPTYPLIKDGIYEIAEQHHCDKCDRWHVGLLAYPVNKNVMNLFECSTCDNILADNSNHFYHGCKSSRFAPIAEAYATSAIKELASLAMETPSEVDVVREVVKS